MLLLSVTLPFRDSEISLRKSCNSQIGMYVCVKSFFFFSFSSFLLPLSPGGKSPGQVVVLDQMKGDQGHTRTVRRGRFDKVSIYRFDAMLI